MDHYEFLKCHPATVCAACFGIARPIVNGKPFPRASEGGHVDSAPRDTTEIELLKLVLSKMPLVSVERLVSAPGLFSICSRLKKYRRRTEPEWLIDLFNLKDASQVISEVAMAEEDPICVEAPDIFTAILGSVAGNPALTAPATGEAGWRDNGNRRNATWNIPEKESTRILIQ